ncbi:MAG: hypothetical protein MSG64_20855 [Pyrinomonadaceae bacterium MAG19_C2-C3]|nr:hypothetical protein [Pyrinomonadaceae bacterium MAG19_C2-C3]
MLSDTGYTVRLSAPPEPYPGLEILLWLIVFFPIGIIVVVMRASYQPPEVTIRYASDNTVEEDGFTLNCLHRVEQQLQRRRRRSTRLIMLVIALVVGALIGLLMLTNHAR